MFKRILIAVNSSPQATYALEAGVQLAEQLGAEVALVHVINTHVLYATEFGMAEVTASADLKKTGENLLQQMEQAVPPFLHHRTFLREGDPAEEIVDAAREWQADLIVTGTHGRGRVSQFILGSTAESLIRHAPCPVIAVREKVAPRAPQTQGTALNL